jgi:hypothetical protein
MIVRLKHDVTGPSSLKPEQFYFVIGIEADDYRILDDHGKPYLYEAELFEVIDPHEPEDWISEMGEDGERYAYPPMLNRVGFFEDFFDGDPQAIAEFWETVNQRMARVA